MCSDKSYLEDVRCSVVSISHQTITVPWATHKGNIDLNGQGRSIHRNSHVMFGVQRYIILNVHVDPIPQQSLMNSQKIGVCLKQLESELRALNTVCALVVLLFPTQDSEVLNLFRQS